MSKLSETTNNPFNIRFSERNIWLGSYHQTPIKGFVHFIDVIFGLRAGFILLRNYLLSGRSSVREIISRYAPPTENDTDHYIEFVEDFIVEHNCNPDYITTKDLSFFYLCCAICKFESGFSLSLLEYNYIISRFGIQV